MTDPEELIAQYHDALRVARAALYQLVELAGGTSLGIEASDQLEIFEKGRGRSPEDGLSAEPLSVALTWLKEERAGVRKAESRRELAGAQVVDLEHYKTGEVLP